MVCCECFLIGPTMATTAKIRLWQTTLFSAGVCLGGGIPEGLPHYFLFLLTSLLLRQWSLI